MPHNLQPYGGSAYFCLPKNHVSYIIEYLKDKPDILDFFRHTFALDEIFFQIIIMNSPLRETVVTDNLRYIDWSMGGPHPSFLTMADVDKLLNTSKLFARKFDVELDEKILNFIDSHKN